MRKADLFSEAFLAQLQGNILKYHGRKHVRHVLFSFKDDKVREICQRFVTLPVTSAAKQKQDAIVYKNRGVGNELFLTFFLSYCGYRKLGYEASQIPQPSYSLADYGLADDQFAQGMRVREQALRYGEHTGVAEWDILCPPQGFDAMILLAHDSESRMKTAYQELESTFRPFCASWHLETGIRLEDDHENLVEHFGYLDGISQPKPAVAHASADPMDMERILVKDPAVQCGYGSFVVFRKLEQNVQQFHRHVCQLANELVSFTPDGVQDVVGAMAVGRFTNGVPVMFNQRKWPPSRDKNDFNFIDCISDSVEPIGKWCPMHAHIRQMNPRLKQGCREYEERKMMQILRRSIPYNELDEEPPTTPYCQDVTCDPDLLLTCPTGRLGMLFLSYQAHLGQFEYLQRQAYSPEDEGMDPILGRTNDVGESTREISANQRWRKLGYDEEVDYSFTDVVTLRGGEYFFAPSISFLDVLASL